jgi:hypothetical protein
MKLCGSISRCMERRDGSVCFTITGCDNYCIQYMIVDHICMGGVIGRNSRVAGSGLCALCSAYVVRLLIVFFSILNPLSALARNMPRLQWTNIENWKQIYPEEELREQQSQFPHSCVCERFIYIPTIDLPILLQEICGPILGIYKSLTDTWMWEFGRRKIPRKGIHKWDFRCSAYNIYAVCCHARMSVLQCKTNYLLYYCVQL